MALDEFGWMTGGSTYHDWPGNGPWYKKFDAFLGAESKTKISFNLDGISDPVASAAAGRHVDPSGFEGLTNWELHRLSEPPEALARTTFYRDGDAVDSPFK
jgi:hypothetical protein